MSLKPSLCRTYRVLVWEVPWKLPIPTGTLPRVYHVSAILIDPEWAGEEP